MIHINNIDETSYHKLKVTAKLVKEETRNKPLDEVIVFTDDIKTIKQNLNYIFDLYNINLKLHVVPLSYKEHYIGKIRKTTIVLEIQLLFSLFKIDLIDKSSYIIYSQSDKLIEIRTKIYEPIIEGVIS